MAFASPKVVLQVLAGLLGVFAVAMLTSPVAFLSQYNVDFSTWKLDGKMLMISLIQGWGVNNLLLVSACLSAARMGSEETQGLMCLSFGCSFVFSIIMNLISWEQALAMMNGKPGGMYFNLTLSGGFVIACFGAASSNLKMSSLSKPIYWATIAMCLMNICYFLVMLFSPESLLAAYGFAVEGDTQVMILFMLKKGMTIPTLQVILAFLTALFSNDAVHQYFFNRFLSLYLGFMFIICCVSGAWWKASGYEASGNSMTQNSFLMGTLFLISFHSNTKYDGAIQIQDAIDAEPAKGRESPLLADVQIE